MRDDCRGVARRSRAAELVAESQQRLAELEEELKLALVEKDPADDKDVIVEIRQGVGGDEAAIWAGDVLRMLTRYAESRGFKTEVLSANESESGGFKEVVFAVKGGGAYSVFKYEGGTHRVQRVPATESQGRIHTSTATAAVMPEVEEIEVEIDENDLKIDVYRSTGPWRPERQHDRLGRPDHPPADRDRRRDAGREVAAPEQGRRRCGCCARGIYEAERERQQAELSETRRSQIGSGERAEKIRTYNYPDSRATDHRVKVTLNLLEKVLQGGLDDFTTALQEEDRRRGLEGADGSTAALSLGDVLRRASEHLGKTLRDRPPRRGAPARAHARTQADRALHRLRPAAQLAGARRLPRGGGAPRAARAASPTSSASGASGGSRSTSTARALIPRPGDGDRRRARARAPPRRRRAGRARRRHRHGSDRARDRRRAAGRARDRDRRLGRRARARPRERRAHRPRDRAPPSTTPPEACPAAPTTSSSRTRPTSSRPSWRR